MGARTFKGGGREMLPAGRKAANGGAGLPTNTYRLAVFAFLVLIAQQFPAENV
jgi:hypothetical protein